MRALTLNPEWAWAVTNLDKRIENREWCPSIGYIQQNNGLIAIHAGKHINGTVSKKTDETGLRMVSRQARRSGWVSDVGPAFEEGEVMAYFRQRGAPLEDMVMVTPDQIVRSSIVAVVRYDGVSKRRMGPWCGLGRKNKPWMLADVIVLDKPIPCKRGFLGLWEMEEEVSAALAEVMG